ncbi:MAG: DUF3634 family protein [Labilithrix sp.]
MGAPSVAQPGAVASGHECLATRQAKSETGLLDATSIVFIAVVVAALGGLYLASLRATTIVDLAIEAGRMRVVRGGVAPPILADLRDIVRDPPVAEGHVRVVRASGRAEVELRGAIDERQAQRIRNVIGSVPLARLVNAKRK